VAPAAWQENLEEIDASAIPTSTKVFVNGCWVGIHHDPDALVHTLRDLRRWPPPSGHHHLTIIWP
jgi:RNA polymerase Rpb2, domain 4.